MTVEYRPEQSVGQVNDGFTQTLKETAAYFEQTHQIQITGQGFNDIVTDNTTFNSYVDHLVENMDATEEQTTRTLLENARTQILRESSTAGIPAITSMTMPVIRKMWAKIALKYAVPTEAVKTPTFSVAFSRPYIIDPVTKEKFHLPESLRDKDSTLAEKQRLSTNPYTLPLDQKDVLSDVGRPAKANNSIDRKFAIRSLVVTVQDASGANPEEVTITKNSKLDINNRLYVEVTAKHSDGTLTSDIVMGSVDTDKGLVSLTSLRGHVKSVVFDGFVSSESHTRATNVSFDIERRDISIGTGEHIEASLPLEYLNDAMAMYSVDGMAEVSDVMSNVTALKVDQDIYRFIEASFEAKPTYRGRFDVHPAPQFAGNPRNWLDEIKRTIDHYATKIKSETYYYNGYFVIVGNPLDTQIIPNVSWTFNHVSDSQNGVDVDYSIGAMSGANRYTIIASDLIPQGSLTMFFVPLTNKFLTLKFYPYTFNVVNNYLNTLNPNIPSIMMTKRYTLEEFIPMTIKIDVLNNDGSLADYNFGQKFSGTVTQQP